MAAKEWGDWSARWIWLQEEQETTDREARHERVYFRRVFELPAGTGKAYSMNVAITADSRYRLFVNGQRQWAGPCKGHEHVHYYEEYSVEGVLQPGINVIAVTVVHYAGTAPFEMGEDGPLSVWRSEQGGLLVEAEITADGQLVQELPTDTSWKCIRDHGYRLRPFPMMRWMGGLEETAGDTALRDWMLPEYDDSAWSAARVVQPVRDEYGQLTPWQLARRPVPLLYEQEQCFLKLMRSSCGEGDALFTAGHSLELKNGAGCTSSSIVVPAQGVLVQAGEQLWLELDAGELTTGYPQLKLQGGGGSLITLQYAECYEEETGNEEIRRKAVRDEMREQVLRGGHDSYQPAGYGTEVQPEVYEPFWFRTFRYVRLEVHAGHEPLRITGLSYRETGYPLQLQGSFHCSDERYNRLWELCVRTLRRCMHETYEDTPYYEQLQYTMDTKLMMEFTYLLSGDDRLARRAMEDYRASQLPSGMLQSRYPSVLPQVIPSFSLYWIGMIHDHYRSFRDVALVKHYRPAILSVLDWFDQRLTPQGLVDRTPRQYWNYYDWVEEWPLGAPDCTNQAPATLMSLMYAYTLGQAAELLEASGWTQIAAELGQRKAAVNAAVLDNCRQADGPFFRDSPEAGPEIQLSQHTQLWAVLAGTVSAAEGETLLQTVLTHTPMAKLSLPMSYYLFRALELCGMYDRSFGLWARWLKQLELGLTTLPEIDSADTRSDCHAWSALPITEFTRGILGVRQENDGIVLQPHCGELQYASGAVSTDLGLITVSWEITTEEEIEVFHLEAVWTAGSAITVILPNGEVQKTDTGLLEVEIDISGFNC
ncbi:family 78 glycoside hydrolase catalytic domain [Paenibacillus sp. FSL M7-0420]|uniref:family 78 glycoside hydrolase catalytic domain n=1 Tax=Paenibacillus sp. FSL M7-0420 TaxID=2921609 RepID=UPI0030F9BA16